MNQCSQCGNALPHVQPEGYKGRVYEYITDLHKDYLRALAEASREGFVTERDWLKACFKLGVETNKKKYPQHISPSMLYGVFVYHGLIEILKGKPYRYSVSKEGLEYLNALNDN